jgi:hypothetical protein
MIHGYTNKDTRKVPQKKKKDSMKRALLPRKVIAQINKKKGYVALETMKDNRKTE